MIAPHVGESTSSGSHWPGGAVGCAVVISATSAGVRAGVREVAMTVCPAAWAWRAMARPRPEEQPVMSQVRGRLGGVKEGAKSMDVETMLGSGWSGWALEWDARLI